MEMIRVTGGAGFIGGCFIRQAIEEKSCRVVNLDKLTYADNLDSLHSIEYPPRYRFIHGDIADQETVEHVFNEYESPAVVHFAAESHVDRSIDRPAEFVRTNVLGALQLPDAAWHYASLLPSK